MRRSEVFTMRGILLLGLWVLLATSFLGAVPASAQGTGETVAGAEEPVGAWGKIFRDSAEVRVLELEVFVRDAEGHPVEGLSREDFELLVDGEPEVIDNFYAVAGGRLTSGAGTTEEGEAVGEDDPRPRLLVIFVDPANLSISSRGRAFAGLREALLRHWDPGMEVLLVLGDTEGTTLHIPLGVSAVPHEVFVALEAAEAAGVSGRRFELEERQILREMAAVNLDVAAGFVAVKGFDEEVSQESMASQAVIQAEALIPQIRTHAQQRLDHTRERLAVLRRFIDLAAGLGERSALLYVADRLSLRPGEMLFEAFEERFASLASVAPSLGSQFELQRYDATEDFLHLVEHANASEVTVYGLDGSTPDSAQRGAATDERFIAPRLGNLAEAAQREGRLLLADGTGGLSNRGIADLDALLDGVFDDFEDYYSLGFEIGRRSGNDPSHRLEVRLRDPDGERGGWRLRHRRSARPPSDDARLSQRALGALLTGGDANPLAIELTAGPQEPGTDETVVLPLGIHLPIGRLVLEPGPREHQARLSVYVAVGDAKGRTSPVVKHVCPVRIPNAELLTALGRGAGCGIRLALRPGPSRIAVVVHDELAARVSTVILEVDLEATPGTTSSPTTEVGTRR